MCEIVIDDIGKLLEAARAAVRKFRTHTVWFRGQAKQTTEWPLCPEVYRSDLVEHNLVLYFKRQSKSRHRDCPDDNQPFAWLTLMRHYGLPTRLLDWSETILVAVFFAVEEPDHYDTDGVLLALSPGGVNASQGRESTITVGSGADVSAKGAFVRQEVQTDAVVAVLPDEVDPRMMAQQSAFTLHGSKRPLDETPGHEEFLMGFRIPAANKAILCNQLRLFGVKRSTLFPDLANLARDLVSDYHRLKK